MLRFKLSFQPTSCRFACQNYWKSLQCTFTSEHIEGQRSHPTHPAHKQSLTVRTLFSFNFSSLSAEMLWEHVTSRFPFCPSSCVVKILLDCNRRALIYDILKCHAGQEGSVSVVSSSKKQLHTHPHTDAGSAAAAGGLVRWKLQDGATSCGFSFEALHFHNNLHQPSLI